MGGGRVGVAAVAVEHQGAVGHVLHQRGAQGVAFGIGVVGQHGAAVEHGVFIDRRAVCQGHGGIVDRADVDRGRGLGVQVAARTGVAQVVDDQGQGVGGRWGVAGYVVDDRAVIQAIKQGIDLVDGAEQEDAVRARVGHGHAGRALAHGDHAVHCRQPDLEIARGRVHVDQPQAGVVKRQIGLLGGRVDALPNDGPGRIVDGGHGDGGAVADGQRWGGAGVHAIDGGHGQRVQADMVRVGQVAHARGIGQGRVDGVDGVDAAGQGHRAVLGVVLNAAAAQARGHIIAHAQAAVLHLERDGDGRAAGIGVGDAQAEQGARRVFGGRQAGRQVVDRARVGLDVDGQGLVAGQLPVAGADLHFIAVDAARITGGLCVGRRGETKLAGLGVDVEQAAIGPTGDAVAELRAGRLVVGGLHGGDVGAELVDQHGGVGGSAIAVDDGGDVGRLHRDVQGLLVPGAVGIHHPHGHLVDVVQVRVLRVLVVHDGVEHQLARAAVDGEQRAVRATADRVDQGVGILVRGLDGGGHRVVVEHHQVGRAAPTAADDHRGLIDVEHGDGQGLAVLQGAIAGRHGHHVAVVPVAVLRAFVVRGAGKAQGAGEAVNGEARGVRTTGDAVGQGAVGVVVVGGHGGDRRGVLVDADRGRGAGPIAVDDGRGVQGQRQAVDVAGRDAHAGPLDHDRGRGDGGVGAGGSVDRQPDHIGGGHTGVAVGHLRVGLGQAQQQRPGAEREVAQLGGGRDHLQGGDGAFDADVIASDEHRGCQVAHLVAQDVCGAGVAIAVGEQDGAGRQRGPSKAADRDVVLHQGQSSDAGVATQPQGTHQAGVGGEDLGEGAGGIVTGHGGPEEHDIAAGHRQVVDAAQRRAAGHREQHVATAGRQAAGQGDVARYPGDVVQARGAEGQHVEHVREGAVRAWVGVRGCAVVDIGIFQSEHFGAADGVDAIPAVRVGLVGAQPQGVGGVAGDVVLERPREGWRECAAGVGGGHHGCALPGAAAPIREGQQARHGLHAQHDVVGRGVAVQSQGANDAARKGAVLRGRPHARAAQGLVVDGVGGGAAMHGQQITALAFIGHGHRWRVGGRVLDRHGGAVAPGL